MNKQISTTSSEVSQKEQNQIILYRPNDTISLEVRLENETVWLTQEMMSDLSVSCCKICNNCFRW